MQASQVRSHYLADILVFRAVSAPCSEKFLCGVYFGKICFDKSLFVKEQIFGSGVGFKAQGF